eukprot:SAG22_NODE_4611_length_1216_cov_2.119964_1_plen_90_part_10
MPCVAPRDYHPPAANGILAGIAEGEGKEDDVAVAEVVPLQGHDGTPSIGLQWGTASPPTIGSTIPAGGRPRAAAANGSGSSGSGSRSRRN